jgi:hypothetical protein
MVRARSTMPGKIIDITKRFLGVLALSWIATAKLSIEDHRGARETEGWPPAETIATSLSVLTTLT